MSNQDGGALERVDSYQWPSGHVGHLTENQINALDRFKQLCESKGYFTPGSADGKTPHSHDDETLLRYLRARKFVPSEAFTQFKDTEDWRNETQLDALYETIDVEEYDATRRLYPQWTGRRDKRGIPLYVYEIAHVDPKAVSAYASGKDAKNSSQTSLNNTSKTPRKMLRLFALYENLCRFVLPLCSAMPDRSHAESPISQSNNIVDLSKVGITKFWGLRNHMSDASTLATAHYPETLDRIFVIGAPSFFPTVWQWAQRWFDPITVSKIFILSDKDMFPILSKYVDPENIPKKYGGQLDWSFGDMPFLEPGIANNLRWKEDIREKGHRTLPKGPIRWQYDEDGDLTATAIGSENGKPRNRVIAGLHPEAGVARLALSPGRADHKANSLVGAALDKTKSPVTQQHQEKQRAEANGSATAPVAAVAGTTAAAGAAAGAAWSEPAIMNQEQADLNEGRDPRSSVPDASRAGTYTVPYRDDKNDVASPPPDSRQGTSSTRFEQQSGTHAHGQLAKGTPEVKVDSQGERQGIMEPNTVGQAPKEHPMPKPEERQPSMMEQAQNYAGQAVEQAKALPQTVMSAVGMGGEKEEPKKEEGPREDPEVDGMPNKNVEEFLRTKTMSVPQEPGR